MHDPDFMAAVRAYARLRSVAYARVEQLTGMLSVDVPIRLAELNRAALDAWRTGWRRRHPLGYGGWDWPGIVAPVWRRPSAFSLAIWSDDTLCGLAVGRASKRRPSGVRHTLSVHYLEGNPDPLHPLRGQVAPIALAAAEAYGAVLGAWRLRLIDPLPGVHRVYERLGFRIAHSSAARLYFEKRIEVEDR